MGFGRGTSCDGSADSSEATTSSYARLIEESIQELDLAAFLQIEGLTGCGVSQPPPPVQRDQPDSDPDASAWQVTCVDA